VVRGRPVRLAWLTLCLLILLVSCSLPGNPTPTPTPTPTATATRTGTVSTPTPESLANLLETEQLLLMTPHPLRDLYSLAQRLKLHTSTPIPHVGRTTPLNEHVGQEDFFWINNADTHRYSRIRAKLVYVTPHVYMYVQDGQAANLNALAASANVFENSIYPTDRKYFGSEWTPGIDDDVHLTILNTAGLGSGIGGYFSASDEYPTSVNPYSNEREMFYVSLDGAVPGSADYDSTLAHEFQHMIHWHLHPVDLSWANEGMSVLAQHINGYPVDGVDQAFLQTPDTQLNDWTDNMTAALAHYGAGYLFMDYFAQHYGGYSILKELLADPAAPPTNFDHVLARHGYNDRFMDVLHKWFVANYVADSTIDQGQYGYPDISLIGLTPQHTWDSYPMSESDTVHQYAAEYYDLVPRGPARTLTISLKGSPTVRITGNDPPGTVNEWWGNRYDNMDSTLTRTFDLTALHGRRATLQFAAWFDLEQDYDYAFVEASTDGVNWTTLKGHYTTTSNPNGYNWGNGYTGESGGGSSPQWVQESINLTPFSGKKVQIRFEEVTDDAVNWQGFALDQIRIPEIHFQDNLTSDNGWISHGFIRSNNVLPERYDMQALIYRQSQSQKPQFTVTDVPVDLASGQATLTVRDFGGTITRVVLIISASAAETTQLAHYQLIAKT
jgi:immune inhibitor A